MGNPVVEHFDTTVFLNSTIFARDLFNVFHETGDPIRFIQIEDYQSDERTGRFFVDGVAQENGRQFRVSPQQLADGDVTYVGGSTIQWEGFRAIAFDFNGNRSEEAVSGRVYTVRENVTRPIARDISISALSYEETSLGNAIQGFDSDGYPITLAQVRLRNVRNGFLSINGEQKTSEEFHLFNFEDRDNVTFTTTGPAAEVTLDRLVYDGELWSRVETSTITVIPNVNRPVAQFSRGTADSREIIPMAPLTNITDDDGNSIKYFEFWNTSPHSNTGNLIFNGVEQPRRTWIRVAADELDQLSYRAPDRDFIQQIRYRGSDGKFQSGNSTISITTNFVIPPIQPTIANDGLVYDQQLVDYRVDQLFTKTDDGNSFTRYQVYDGNGFDQLSARWELVNDPLAALTVHEFTVAEAAAGLRLTTGDYNNRSLDDIYVRAENEDGLWTKWSRLQVRTESEYRTSTTPTSLWTQVAGLTTDSSGRLELSYSFMQDFPDYPTGEAVNNDPPENFTRFNQQQRVSVRRAFDEIERLTNIKFNEVSDVSTNVLGQRGGIFRFGNYGLANSNAAAFAFFPSGAPQAGDSWYNRFALGFPDPTLTPYTGAYTTLLHELMHNLGYNHVFDGSGGTGVLPDVTNTDNFSVLSTFTGERPDGLFPTTPQLYNVESIQIDYGVNFNFNAGDTVYGLADYWSENPRFTENVWDGGGNDTLTLEGSNPAIGLGFPNAIDLSPGGFSTFNGFLDNVSIAFRADIENAIGSDLPDTIRGSHLANVIDGGTGDDLIEGRVGDDTLTGGAGNDTFIWGIGDGDDIIDEKRLAGRDRILVTEFGDTFVDEDDFTENFLFRKEGRDLIVTLQLPDSNVTDGSVRIVNHQWGSYQVETLEFNGIQVDLKNLGQQASSIDQKFTITNDTSTFGNLVAPLA